MFPKIVQVIPTDDYTVFVYFEDGKIVCYNVEPLLSRGVFLALQDKKVFKNACTIMNGTLAWDVSGTKDPYNCIDIDPDTLYELENINERDCIPFS